MFDLPFLELVKDFAHVVGEVADEIHITGQRIIKLRGYFARRVFDLDHLFGVRQDHRRERQVRSQRAGELFERGECFDQHEDAGWDLQLVFDDHVDAFLHRAREIHQLERNACILHHQLVDFEFHLLFVFEEFFTAQYQQGARHQVAVTAREADRKVREEVHVARRERSDHAEVDECDHVARQDEDVARVRIGVEKAVAQDHRQQRVGPVHGDLVCVEPGIAQGLRGVGRDAFHLLHHDQFLGAVFRVDGRDMHGRVVFEHHCETQDVRRFERVVQLFDDRFRKFVDQSDDVDRGQFRIAFRELARDKLHQVDIELDFVLDEGPLDFEHDLFAAAQPSLVDLTDRCGGQWGGVEFGEHFVDRRVHLFFDQSQRSVVVERFGPRLQFLELHAEAFRNHVGTVGQNLSEFHEGRPQLLDGHP